MQTKLRIKRIKSGVFLVLALALAVLLFSSVSAEILPLEVPLHVSYETPFSYYGDAAQYYFPSFSAEMCEIGQDFIIEIPPGACSPAVVRSDLLEELPVPIFCKLTGIKINPLIEVPRITRISVVQKEAHTDIATVLFHPARAGLRTSFAELIGSPTMNDLGYLVVVLKRKATEKEMPDMIVINLTARIEYEVEKTFGIAENQILLEVLTDDEWENTYEKYSFWDGRGYVRAKDITTDKAKIEVYDGSLHLLRTFNLGEGDKSDPSYMPGFYCSAGYKVKLEDIEYPEIRAELYVNGDKLVVTKGMTLKDSECVVEKIIVADYGLGGSVMIRCPEGYYTLTKKATSKANLNVSGEQAKEFSVGDKIYDNLKLVYAGKVLKEGEELKVIVVANVTEKISDVIKEYMQDITKYFEKSYWKDREEKWKEEKSAAKQLEELLEGYLEKSAVERIKNVLKLETKVWVIVESGEIDGIKIKVNKIEGLQKIKYDDTLEKYYEKAINTYQDVAETYPDLIDKSGTAYGAKALREAADKAGKLNKTFDKAVILEKLMRNYPNSNLSVEARKELADLYSVADIGKASKFILSEGKGYLMELSDVIEPTREEINVKLSIDNGEPKIFTQHDLLAKDEWQISEIREDRVDFKSLNTSNIIKISEGGEDFLGNTKVRVIEITLKKFARVSVLPWSREGVTLTNFTFRVGIEKRAIKLSPEQTKDYIQKLGNSITKWENINTKLGNIVTTWNKVCLIGAGALWLNNFLDTLSGKGIARNMVMRGFGDQPGMMDECAALEAKGVYGSISECLREKEKSGELNAQIDAVQKAITSCNKIASEIKATSGVTVPGGKILGGLFTGPSRIDNAKYLDVFYDKIEGSLKEDEKPIIKYSIDEEAIFRSDTKDICTYLELKKRYEESTTEEKGKLESLYNKTITVWNSKLGGYNRTKDVGEKQKTELDIVKEKTGTTINFIGSYGKKERITPEAAIFKINKWGATTWEEVKAARFNWEGISYLAIVEYIGGGREYEINELYKINETNELGKRILPSNEKEWPDGLGYTVTGAPEVTKVNKYEGKLEIEFWEKEPYEGMPAKMPLVDLKPGIKGLYFATKQYGYGLEAYLGSAKILNFWICSVGENGIPEWDYGVGPTGDDICRGVPYGETTETQDIPELGLTKGDVERVIRCAAEAAQAYKDGKKHIGTSCCDECNMGKPAVAAPSTTCEDFMSPSQCNLMYNLCDPVVCPASRCDFGGKIPVDDVIQTGIIGGLTLCLPNADEVAVPICLSGVHAGLENYITILKSTQACLKEKLATGKTVGICDQLQSVYICEFFWRQLEPFLKVGVPSLIESIVVGKKSGGEYLTFSNAWKNAQDSAKYILSYYKEDALRAFKISSIAEAGTPVCRAFVSLRYPNQADLFEELTKPESPYQLNAIFYETPMTTVTVPAMSHYKVYYHIYSGEEKGHYYMVYLKQPPQPGYYETPEMYPVPEAFGYIPAGQFVDVAKDFTAPASYMELCVRIDAKDHCGFGKATTSLGVEELMNLYVSEQAATEVATEKECISGTSGMIAPNLNPQALVEETLEPALWRRGIIRICSSVDPGKGTEPGRWVSVGYCDSKNVKCWLDTESVEGAIKDIGLQEKTISEAENISRQLLETGFISRENAESLLNEIEKEKPAVLDSLEGLTKKEEIDAKISDIVTRLRNLTTGALAEDIRARAQIQIGAIYNHIAILLKPQEVAKAEKVIEEVKEEEKVEEKEEKVEPEAKPVEEKKEEKPQSQLELASIAYRNFLLLIGTVIKNNESKCYSTIDSVKEDLDEYKIRMRRSLIKGKELCLSVSLFNKTKRRFDVFNLFPKENLIKESIVCTEKEGIVEADTGFFIEGGAIQTMGMVLEIKEGKLVATPDIYRAKGIENPVLFKTELSVSYTSRKLILGFMQEGAKEITKKCK